MSDDKIFIKIEPQKPPQVSVHNDGRLFFGKQATRFMGLYKGKAFKIAKGKTEKCIFLFPVTQSIDTIKLSKQGLYFYFVNTTIFRKLGFIRNEKYNISAVNYKDETIFKISL